MRCFAVSCSLGQSDQGMYRRLPLFSLRHRLSCLELPSERIVLHLRDGPRCLRQHGFPIPVSSIPHIAVPSGQQKF